MLLKNANLMYLILNRMHSFLHSIIQYRYIGCHIAVNKKKVCLCLSVCVFVCVCVCASAADMHEGVYKAQ